MHTTKMLFTALILLALVNISLSGQDSGMNIHELLDAYMAQGIKTTIDSKDILKCQNVESIIPSLQIYEKGESGRVKRRAYMLDWAIGLNSSDPEIRQGVVERLISGCWDWDVRGQIYPRLLIFTEVDFSEKAKVQIREHLARERPSRGMVLVCGLANMKDQIPRLRELAADRTQYELGNGDTKIRTVGWKARLALARMGSQEDIQYCIKRAEKCLDLTTFGKSALEDIAYIRQPEAVKYLQKFLEGTESPPDIFLEVGIQPGTFAKNALKNLTKMIDDFPVEEKVTKHSDAELETARQWMRKQTEFKIKR